MTDEVTVPMQMPSYGIPQQMPSGKADIIDKIKPEKIAEIIRYKLLGKELIGNNWVDIPALKDHKLTDVGAYELSNSLLGIANISTAVSKLNDREIKKRLRNFAKDIQIILVQNWVAYGLKSTAQQRYIHNILFTGALVVLKQADDASIQELIKGTVQENRLISSSGQKEGRGQKITRMLGLGE